MKLTKLLLGIVAACALISGAHAQTTSGAIEQLPIHTLSHVIGHDGGGHVGREPVTDFLKPGSTSPTAGNLACWGSSANLITDCGSPGSMAFQNSNAVAITGGSAIFTGITTAPTKSQGDNSTNVATTAYVDTGLGTKASLVGGVISIAQGGTNSATAAGARTNLGLGTIATQDATAISITGGSITGITDLAVGDGGTGSSTAAGARTNLGAAASGANGDITSITGLTTALSVTQGGTGSTSAAAARTALSAAASGGNSDITSISGLTTPLSVAQGGSGANTASSARTNFGLGTAATQNTGTSGATIPFLNTANTWTLPQTFSANPVFPSQSANVVFAAPNGSSGAPSFRALVAQDSGAGVVQYDLSRNSTANNASIALSLSGASFSASGTAGTTCGGGGTFNFPCLQNQNISADTVDASTGGALDGWQFTHNFGGSTVKGARQSVDIISTFTAATSASNANRNYVPFATYMQINSGDGGTAGTPLGNFFGANHVVRGTATNLNSVVGLENDINVSGTMKYRFGFSSVSFPGSEATIGDAAYELHASSGTGSTNWVNALYLSNVGGIAPLATGGCVVCTDGSANTIAQGIDLHTYTVTGYFLRSANFSVDGSGNTTATSYRLSNMLSTTAVPVIASGFCTSPTIAAANGTAAFKIFVGSGCSAGTGTLTMPAAANDWSCTASDLTNPGSHVIVQAGHSTTSAAFQDYSRTTGAAQTMGSGDVILVQCSAL